VRVGGGYLGEAITHPGLVLVVERPKLVAPRLELFAAADVGAYWHPRAEAPLFIDARGGLRWLSKGRYSADASIGAGWMHAFIASETVNFDNRGRSAALFVVDVGFLGINLARDGAPELRLSSSLRFLVQYPVNNHAVLHPALTLMLTRALGRQT